jgi:hypothetical protein
VLSVRCDERDGAGLAKKTSMNKQPRSPLSALSPEQLMERAREYRRMAANASTVETRDALNGLAYGSRC